MPYGNVTEEPLIQILESLVGQAEFEAIAMGHPERMGIRRSVTVEKFLELSRTTNARGQTYVNRCIGCDRFHEIHLAPVLEQLQRKRRRRNLS